ncbi:hypothetical protein ACFV5C_14665, partial [Streptomyces sp. NPDC059762]
MSATDWSALGANLAATAATALMVLLATFAVAVRRDLHRVVDIAWGLAFAAVAAVTWLLSAGHGEGPRPRPGAPGGRAGAGGAAGPRGGPGAGGAGARGAPLGDGRGGGGGVHAGEQQHDAAALH